MAFSGVDKFPLVAKILVDMRLQELVQENRKLREDKEMLELRVFWKSHNMIWFNSFIQDTLKTRVNCPRRGFHTFFNAEPWECTLRSAFKSLAEEHGLSVVPEDDEYDHSHFFDCFSTKLENVDNDWKYNFCSGDVHFVVTSSHNEFCFHGYGEKLMQAKSMHDPEVVKLKHFFETLERMRP